MENKHIGKGFINFAMTITFSKIMAFYLITLSFIKDDGSGNIFMFTIPFAVLLITGKQVVDLGKEKLKQIKE